MPNRIIKESICSSDTIDSLSWFEEVVFYRLVVNCDDYGRFDGRIPIIKNRLFPLKENVTNKSIAEAINKLSTAGLVIPYEYDGKPILQLVTWDKHQIVRNKRSKYPAIDGSEETTATENVRLISIESNCMQLNANVTVIQSNPIQSESNPNPNPNPNPNNADKPQKHKYGEYQNVLLTDEEFEKLKNEFHDYQERIERLSGYIASVGKKYKSHYATIRQWAAKDKPKSKFDAIMNYRGEDDG